MCLQILLKSENSSWNLWDLPQLICMAISFLKIIFESRDLLDLRDLYVSLQILLKS